MITYESTKIRKYEVFIRDILNSIVKKIDLGELSKKDISFRAKIQDRLKFDSDVGWLFLTSSLDIVGDSQVAIVEFMNNKIQNLSISEKYLRLYGVLSAIYIQQQAILKLYEIFKINYLRTLKAHFDNLKITFLRHCISAHPINYNNNGEIISFKIVRSSLYQNENLIIQNSNNSTMEMYNIFTAIEEYQIEAENTLKKISSKIINVVYNSSKEKESEFRAILDKI